MHFYVLQQRKLIDDGKSKFTSHILFYIYLNEKYFFHISMYISIHISTIVLNADLARLFIHCFEKLFNEGHEGDNKRKI